MNSEPAPTVPWSDDNRVLAYRAFVFDFNDDDFGGYVWGEFLLLEDGVLFMRFPDHVAEDKTRRPSWKAWNADERWTGGPSVEAFTAWAKDHGYDLSYPDHGPD